VKRELNRLKEKFEHYMSFMFPKDPLAFFEQNLGFKPTEYQVQLTKFFTENQFVAARWCRQSGKSHIISALLLHYALIHPDTYIAVVGPSWRQTKLIIRRINSFLRKLPKGSYHKPQKTIAHLSNGSIIEAFPNNPETIRGPSLHVVYCLPSYVNVALSDGTQIPIKEVKPGQQVLTYNKFNGKIEAKKVLRVFHNSVVRRKVVRISHDFGWLDCTTEHRVFTLNRGYTPAIQLCSGEKILYLADIMKSKVNPQYVSKAAIPTKINTASRATYLWQFVRRFVHRETKGQKEERSSCDKPLLKTGRIRSIQILNPEKLCENSPTPDKKRWLGQRSYAILCSIPSIIHRNLSYVLSKWKENSFFGMVIQNRLTVRVSSLVYGRRFSGKKGKSENQHPPVFGRGTLDPSAVVTKPLGDKTQNCRGQTWQRVLFNVLSRGQRQILQHNPSSRYSEYALQNPSRIEACAMRDMRQACFAEKGCFSKREKNSLLKYGMQKVAKIKISSALESSTPCMCDLRQNLSTVDGTSKDLQQGVLKKTKVTKEAIVWDSEKRVSKPKRMFGLWASFHSNRWTPKNLQFRMSQATQAKIPTRLRTETEVNEVAYNIEVEGNHNFFADGVLVSNCDEMNFIQNDEELYDAILFTLSATNGKFICSSTPWSTDSIFYKIFNHEDYADFKRSHVTWRDAVEPEGPLKRATLEKIQRQFQGDHWRWKREMEAEWAENESVWLPQALITSCIDHTLYYIDFNERAKGEFFAGIDLGKHQDYSVISVVMREKNLLKLVHVKRFPLKTAYASVIGYIKTLCDRWSSIQKVSVDMSGVGDYIVEDMQNAGIHGVQGIKFTQPTKEQLATNLKQQMVEGVFKIPYDPDLIAELNVERFELRKTGGISFSHPEGTHDDKFWSVALALHSSRVETPSQLVRAY